MEQWGSFRVTNSIFKRSKLQDLCSRFNSGRCQTFVESTTGDYNTGTMHACPLVKLTKLIWTLYSAGRSSHLCMRWCPTHGWWCTYCIAQGNCKWRRLKLTRGWRLHREVRGDIKISTRCLGDMMVDLVSVIWLLKSDVSLFLILWLLKDNFSFISVYQHPK